MTKLNVVAFIFARGGSKGVPGKNIKPLAGKPLIAHTIETAKKSPYIERVIISTDDEEIAEVAQLYGGEVPFMRPGELAGDKSSEWLAWRHALEFMEKQSGEQIDLFVSVPTTSPLRQVEDINACIERYLQGDVDVVISITPAQRNPYFNMVTLSENGLANIAIKADSIVSNRQEAPDMYDITTVCYAVNPILIKEQDALFAGKVGTVQVPQERSLDIDTEYDFRVAEALLAHD
ncbi:MAG: acylneuraminate cytidylyltransferase family protein [Rhodospirillales bacterium]|nr:acylneuraminate cytidylyltransferase family protein [Rhodospirillales bacterium]